MREVKMNKNDSGQRLDKFLMKYFENLPLSLIYKFIRKGRVKVNNKKQTEKYMLADGDLLQMYVNDELFITKEDNSANLSIKTNLELVYEDENILLVDKKPGILSHSEDENEQNTLIYHITAYLFQKGEYIPNDENTFAPALCNRIDRNTGGIVICAKNAESLRIMNDKIKHRELEKKYLCIACGKLPKKEDELIGYHFKDASKNKVFIKNSPDKTTKKIVTKYKVIKEKGNLSLVEVELITGRTHQIRAHLSHIGNPLLGDGKYGLNKLNKGYGKNMQALYSYKLKFTFTTDAGCLNYLNGKEFTVKNVPFASNF